MSGHTPGPWVAVLEGDQRSLGYIREERKTDDGRQIAVAQATKTGRAYSEFRANAALIAAAPDLLIALESLMDTNGDQTYCLSAKGCGCCHECTARAAIAKARGVK